MDRPKSGCAAWRRGPVSKLHKPTGRFRLQVLVRDNNVDQALKALKKKMQREGLFREMKLRNYYEKPSERRAREKAEAVRRARKLARKRAQREGIAPPGGHAANPRAAAGGRGGRGAGAEGGRRSSP
jgi:small subunit ribosomal protein S21